MPPHLGNTVYCGYNNDMKIISDKKEAAIKSWIDELVAASDAPNEIFGGLTTALCEYFGIFKVTLVHISDDNTLAYTAETENQFLHTKQAEALLHNRKLVFMNTQVIRHLSIGFMDALTNAACILPLRKEKILLGFLIMEDRNNKAVSADNEAALLYIAKVLGEWLEQKTWAPSKPTVQALPLPEPQPETVFTRLARIDGLQAEAALEGIGGLTEVYEQTVRVCARLLPETIAKMDKYLHDTQISDFAIEVHGAKGVLRNIGAAELGSIAAELETAAKGDNTDFCQVHYPAFKEKLTAFHAQLNEALTTDDDKPTALIEKDELLSLLSHAKYAVEDFDAINALEILSPLSAFSYNDTVDAIVNQVIFALEEFNFDGALHNINKAMEEI
jgi:HPt (histidine-containing phosphotransfer) domain-containing protein